MQGSNGAQSEQEIVNRFNQMKQELQNISQKLGELDAEKQEHQLVVDTLEPLDPSRSCYRLIGGILVKKDIQTTLPAVKENLAGVHTDSALTL